MEPSAFFAAKAPPKPPTIMSAVPVAHAHVKSDKFMKSFSAKKEKEKRKKKQISTEERLKQRIKVKYFD